MIRFPCACGRQLQASDTDAGRAAVCPLCGRQHVVPREAVAEAAGGPLPGSRRPAGAWRAPSAGRSDLPGARLLAELAEPPTSGAAMASFVLGLLSLVFNVFTGIPAVMLGAVALVRTRGDRPRFKGAGLAGWGMTTGLIGIFIVTPLVVGLTRAVTTRVWGAASLHLPAGLDDVPVELPDRERADREASMDNLGILGDGMLNYEAQNHRFPPAAFSQPAGKPLLSWRVAILPYLNDPEAAELYREFKLDEPWNGPHNFKLLERMPAILELPGRPAPRGHTYYQVLTGPRTAFESPRGQRVEDFTDPPEDTFLIVEAAIAVPWTKPDDLRFHPNGLLPPFGRHYGGGFHAAFADGSVDYIEPDTDTEWLRAMVTRNGGERMLPPP
jgi:hypothetical protein